MKKCMVRTYGQPEQFEIDLIITLHKMQSPAHYTAAAFVYT